MHMVLANMSGKEHPLSILTDFANRLQNRLLSEFVKSIWRLRHDSSFKLQSLVVFFHERSSELVVFSIH